MIMNRTIRTYIYAPSKHIQQIWPGHLWSGSPWIHSLGLCPSSLWWKSSIKEFFIFIVCKFTEKSSEHRHCTFLFSTKSSSRMVGSMEVIPLYFLYSTFKVLERRFYKWKSPKWTNLLLNDISPLLWLCIIRPSVSDCSIHSWNSHVLCLPLEA